MRTGRAYLLGLAELHHIADGEERRRTWRQAMASLAAIATDREPAPLEGLAPAELLAGVRAAAEAGLLDDLDWLSPPAATVAMFELANALPAGNEKRELGRRVLERLHDGDAATFVGLATSLALSARRPLQGAAVRARVAAALAAPLSAGLGVDNLALALVSRADLEHEWLVLPSTSSLPERRLAARLLERAARAAVLRSGEGDDSGVRVLARPTVREVWHRLLADRESLVWRHVAVARGLLAAVEPVHAEEIDAELRPHRTAEWRRAATSLAAAVERDPDRAVARARALVGGEPVRRDPGITRAIMHGLYGAFAVEPEAADELAAELIGPGGVDAIDALVELRRELPAAGARAVNEATAWLATAIATDRGDDDGASALLVALRDALDGDLEGPARGGSCAAALVTARTALHDGDGARAIAAAGDALTQLRGGLTWLEGVREERAADRRRALAVWRDLDAALEDGTLREVLGLDGRGVDAARLLDDFEQHLLNCERAPAHDDVAHPTLRMVRLRVLVRLLDREDGDRRIETARILLDRAVLDTSPLLRAVWAALARACDALLRDEDTELSDLLLALASTVGPGADFAVLREATMLPQVERVFAAHAELSRLVSTSVDGRAASLALLELSRSLPPAASARVEALRAALLRAARSVARIVAAPSLAVVPVEALDGLAVAAQAIAQLTVGARRRFGLPVAAGSPTSETAMRQVTLEIERALRGEGGDGDGTGRAIAAAIDVFSQEHAPAIGAALALALVWMQRLPWRGGVGRGTAVSAELAVHDVRPLPPWLPASRTIGGFHVLSTIGTGAGGSVFVACRSDDRHDEHAPRFALKVPDYDGGVAGNLSEAEFERVFRDEAGALLALPLHRNIAAFITFDAGARPKPILVMELVAGPTLERVIDVRGLDMRRALAIIDGLAAGLEAMHAARVAHLDVKPANIILRGGDTAATPVLVDFGLAGRTLRAGCGSPLYGAPEVWSPALAATIDEPFAADVYAFACVSWEILTGSALADADTLNELLGSHIEGRAGRATLARLAEARELAPLAETLLSALHREAGKRPTMQRLRARLTTTAQPLAARPWPLEIGGS